MENEQKRPKKKRSAFGKGILIYAVVALILIGAGLGVFWFFIKDYEEGMPSHGMEQVMEAFNEERITELVGDQTFGNSGVLEDASVWINWYKEQIKGKEMTFEEARENTDLTPTYVVKAGEKAVGKVTLEVTGKNRFKFNIWGMDKLDVSEYLPKTAVYTITVPKGSAVTINGHQLGSEYIKQDDVVYEELSGIQNQGYFSEAPASTVYEVSGLLNAPQITAQSAGTKALVLEQKDNSYTYTYAFTDTDTASLKPMTEGIVNYYAMNFIDVNKQIYNHIMPGSELEENIKLTVTGFYPTKYIASYGFDSMDVSNFRWYSDSCFSCDITYSFHVNFQNYSVAQEILPGNMRWYFVNKDGNWYLTDLGYLQ